MFSGIKKLVETQKLRKTRFGSAASGKNDFFVVSSENPWSAGIYNVFEIFKNFRVSAGIYNVVYTDYPL